MKTKKEEQIEKYAENFLGERNCKVLSQVKVGGELLRERARRIDLVGISKTARAISTAQRLISVLEAITRKG